MTLKSPQFNATTFPLHGTPRDLRVLIRGCFLCCLSSEARLLASYAVDFNFELEPGH